MKLTKLKLSNLSDSNLKDKEMSSLIGGKECYCSCYWQGRSGSSVDDNVNANYVHGFDSKDGCNEYGRVDGNDNEWWPESEHA